MTPFETYDEVIKAVEESQSSYQVLNRTPAGHPILDVRTGGDEEPAVFITAGAHATEQAGISAAVALLDRLETDHEVHVIPSRDPIGLDGYPSALSNILGRDVQLKSFDDLEVLLDREGHVVHLEDDVLLALIGDVGFATKRPEPDGDSSQLYLLKYLKHIQHEFPEVLEPFKGRRIYLPAGQPDIPGSGTFDRAYTLVVGPDGRLLHLNRFFETPWAPVEVECTRQVMADIEPALSFDLHETQLIEDRFYFGVNQHGADEKWERELGRAIQTATAEAGAEFATKADVARVKNITVADPDDRPPERPEGVELLKQGCYLYPNPSAGAEGLNATHLEAKRYGPSIGTETGMWGVFEDRVEILLTAVEAGVQELEARH
jgi:hypothetical protein